MPVHHLGRGEGALAFKGKMFIRIPKCCPVWHSGRKFVHYDMFLPVTFPAKKREVSLCGLRLLDEQIGTIS